MCKLCLNTRLLFNVVKQEILDENESISTFFMKSSACLRSPNSFYELECCNALCKNCNQKLPTFDQKSYTNKLKSDYQFEVVMKKYKSKQEGKEKISQKTERVTVEEIFEKLCSLKSTYLSHQWEVENDKLHWKRIL